VGPWWNPGDARGVKQAGRPRGLTRPIHFGTLTWRRHRSTGIGAGIFFASAIRRLGTTGWVVWTGDLSDTDDFLPSWHLAHLVER
jgi:hypothetical protein